MEHADLSGLTLAAMQERADALLGKIIHTPSVRLSAPDLESALGNGEIFLKLECFQHTGTFKARGALSVVTALPDPEKGIGITAASAGNHAIAAAWAARQFGMSAKVVMQSSANPFRVDRARAEGAEVILRDGGPATFAEAERLVRDEGRLFTHPFEGINTTLGTAGVGIEFMQDVPELDAVVVSVGGGGLISGVAAAVKAINPACKVFGVEPNGAASMSQSLAAGRPITLDTVDTVADSLGPPMALPYGYSACAAHVDEIVTVSDDMICAGMVVLLEQAKLAIEPAAGATIAGLLGPLRNRLSGKRIGVIVCGANIDATSYIGLINRGMQSVGALMKVHSD